MPLLHMQFQFPCMCPKRSGKFVACVIHFATPTGMFLESRFPLKHIPHALRTFLIIFIVVKHGRMPLHPPPLCPTMTRMSFVSLRSFQASPQARYQQVVHFLAEEDTNTKAEVCPHRGRPSGSNEET